MISCTACTVSTCKKPCDRVERYISQDYTAMREHTGCLIELVPTSEAFVPPETDFPYFENLWPIENFALRHFYVDGDNYARIAKRLHRNQNTVKSLLARAKKKIASDFSKGKGD